MKPDIVFFGESLPPRFFDLMSKVWREREERERERERDNGSERLRGGWRDGRREGWAMVSYRRRGGGLKFMYCAVLYIRASRVWAVGEIYCTRETVICTVLYTSTVDVM